MSQNEPGMTLNTYRKAAVRTASSMSDALSVRLLNGALGLTGESGEVADIIKKWYFHNHDLDKQHLVEELGDVMWYIASMADALGVTLDEVARVNVEKLMRRYPNGFSTEASKNRSK
jgi:NTP pyrophosphatase (non-canonical NTP hydrolase)